MNIGERLASVRKGKGLSQRALGLLSEISYTTIARIEAGSVVPNTATIESIAKALNVSANYLAGWASIPIDSGDSNVPTNRDNGSTMPSEFILMARKTGSLSEEDQRRVYEVLDSTIDDVLAKLEEEKRGGH